MQLSVLLPEIPSLVPRTGRAPTAIMGPLVEGGLVIGAGNGGYQGRGRIAAQRSNVYCARKGLICESGGRSRYRLGSENRAAGRRVKWIRVEKRSRCGVTVGHLWEAGACGFV